MYCVKVNLQYEYWLKYNSNGLNHTKREVAQWLPFMIFNFQSKNWRFDVEMMKNLNLFSEFLLPHY